MLFLLAVGIAGNLASCSDAPDEITELNLSRYLKVMNLSANSTEGTQVRLNWDKNTKADGYIVEFFADDTNLNFEGEPFVTIDDIGNENLPYTLQSGLEGNTTYAIRVKAVGEKADDSLWSDGVTVTTQGEQLFYPINNEEITYDSAIIRWLASETVTHLLITGGELDNVQINLSGAAIENGEYEITGLSQMTLYTVKLMNGTKQRGEISFTTSINLGDAIEVNPEDDLKELIENAENGDIFALMPGEYVIGSDLTITKSISIMAAVLTDKPILQGAAFKMNANGISIKLKDLILDGLGTQTNVTSVTVGLGIGDIIFESCEILRYQRGFIASGTGNALEINSYVLEDCIVHNFTASNNDTFDFRAAICRNFIITNSTFHNFINGRTLFRVENNGYSNYGGSTSITVNNCTFYNVFNDSSAAFFDVRYSSNTCQITNTIITNTTGKLIGNANTNASFSNNNYFNATVVISDDNTGSIVDPQFADPENGDFTITNDDLKYEGIGDPRWY